MDRRGGITQIDLEYMLHDEDAEPMALPFPLLKKITDDFSYKLEIGRGGFAVVYKAMLDTGAVAVKKLSNTYMYEKEFHREVECLMKVKHKNIVRFLGYCADTQGKMGSFNGKMVMADVQERLLCFEYLPKGSLDGYITHSSGELEWTKRYQVIKGICEGLNYLHQKNIFHLDLKPGNILLDEDMMPKITDFGLSRCFEEDQSRIITKNVHGTLGYLAPEFRKGEITHKFDLYSLGVIIMEMLTGKKGYQTIENVLEIWINTMLDTLQLEQVRVCAKIGIECTEVDPAKRPASMKHIIDRLAETECTHVILEGGTSELLLLHQSALCFPFEPNKVSTCPLQLTNNTDKHVAFRLINKSMESSFLRLPLYGLVPPKTPYTLIVTTQEREEVPRNYIIEVILEDATLIDDEHINTFQRQIRTFQRLPDKFFQEMGCLVQEVKLKAFYTLPPHITTSSSKPISPTIKIICKVEFIHLYSFDINQAKQWIIIGEDKSYVGIWDYQTQRKVDALKVSASYGMITKVTCVKFIARKQWIVVVDNDSHVHVYDYEKMEKITSFKVGSLVSLAVHPTRPYLLSAGVHMMKLWDWDRGWECVQTFEYNKTAYKVAFKLNDTFASASSHYTVEVWSLDSPKCNYVLSGHSDNVNCLDFFTCHDQEFLVTGSDDQTAKIWYLQKKICAYTLEAFVSPVTSVLYQPNLQTLITGLEDGVIYLWSTTNFRIYSCPPMLKRIINIGCVGGVYHLACAMGRVVIGNRETVAIMDIDNVNYQEQSTDYSEQQSSADTRQHAGDTTSKELGGSISKLLGVRPRELHFPYHPDEPIPCSLHLTNNTNKNVAFRLIDKSGKSPWCFTKLPLYGIVPHGSTYILIVTMKEEMKLKERTDFDLVIQSSLLGDKYMLFEDQSESDQFFEEAKEFGNMVHEVTLEAIYVKYYGKITSENISVKYNRDVLRCLDAHPTEPWILTGHASGYVHAWNHEMKYPINSFKVTGRLVWSVNFIARWEWIVVVTGAGDIQVYDCACVKNLKKIRSFELGDDVNPPRLAFHPILPYVLVLRPYKYTMLFIDWKPTRKFSYIGHGPVAFIPWDDNSFVCESEDGELKVWRLDSEYPEYSLLGHSACVQSLDFITRGGKQYLISGSSDSTAKIWDLQKRECICTLEATSPVFCVLAHPKFPALITGTLHGIIQMWSSTDFRLKRTINLGGGGAVQCLACLMGSTRIVIGQTDAISTMVILDNPIPKRRNFFPMRLRCRRKVTVVARGRRLRMNSQGALKMEL